MNSRRKFLRQLGGSSALLAGAPSLLIPATADARTYRESLIESIKPRSAADTINLALIGAGIIGHYDLDCALKVPGTKVVAVADLYQPRLERAKEVWGNDLFITRDFQEILTRKDVDAVLICVPDHWHDHIAIAALKAVSTCTVRSQWCITLTKDRRLLTRPKNRVKYFRWVVSGKCIGCSGS